ncbi:hypothetical protein FACS1894151_04640 [Spirochaetia bacterium]|nr:hypothetical protein FACS1894151_04640 [Spirochaetia bacterium]
MRLALGDIHGRDFWKRYLDEDCSEYYILGDYFDSFDVPFAKQYRNFVEICAAARTDSRIKLCLGNHDFHYLDNIMPQFYSGIQQKHYIQINYILEQNIDLLKIVYVTDDNYILSHAGVSSTYLYKLRLDKPEEINAAFERERDILTFDGDDVYGNDPQQGPIWIRPDSLCADPLPGYNQIVGHTEDAGIRERLVEDYATWDKKLKLVFIDTGDAGTIYRF